MRNNLLGYSRHTREVGYKLLIPARTCTYTLDLCFSCILLLISTVYPMCLEANIDLGCCHGIPLLFPGMFPPVHLSMQLCSEHYPYISTCFGGKHVSPLARRLLCKLLIVT